MSTRGFENKHCTMAYPAPIACHFGVWEGEALHMNLQGEIIDRHSIRLDIGARGSKYSQRNTYTWPDGRKQVLDFPGHFDETTGKLLLESERLAGECIVIDEDTILFKAGYKGQMGGVSMFDLIRVSSDRKTRCRTWQMFKEGKPWKIVNVIEQQVSSEDAFIEMDYS